MTQLYYKERRLEQIKLQHLVIHAYMVNNNDWPFLWPDSQNKNTVNLHDKQFKKDDPMHKRLKIHMGLLYLKIKCVTGTAVAIIVLFDLWILD